MHGRGGGLVYLGVLLIVILLRPDPAAHQMISDGVCQSEIIIPRGGHVPVFDEGEMEMPVEALPNLGHIAQAGDAPHADLLPFLAVGQGNGHPGNGGGEKRWAAAAGQVRALRGFRAERAGRQAAGRFPPPPPPATSRAPEGCGEQG